MCTNSAASSRSARSHRSSPSRACAPTRRHARSAPIVPATARPCAASIRARSYGEETAHSADTDFGALNVMSIPATREPLPPARRSSTPVAGETPRIRRQIVSRDRRARRGRARRAAPASRASDSAQPPLAPPSPPPAAGPCRRRVVVAAVRRRGQIRGITASRIARDLVRRLHPGERNTAPSTLNRCETQRRLRAPHTISHHKQFMFTFSSSTLCASSLLAFQSSTCSNLRTHHWGIDRDLVAQVRETFDQDGEVFVQALPRPDHRVESLVGMSLAADLEIVAMGT